MNGNDITPFNSNAEDGELLVESRIVVFLIDRDRRRKNDGRKYSIAEFQSVTRNVFLERGRTFTYEKKYLIT